MQATDIFTYNMTHCPGAENTATASVLLDTIVRYSHFLLWVSNPGNFSTFITRDFHPIFVKPKNYIVKATCHFRLVERAADENPTLGEVTGSL